MKKRLGLMFAASLGAVILWLVIQTLALPPEPEYQGKPITYWLAHLAGGNEISQSWDNWGLVLNRL